MIVIQTLISLVIAGAGIYVLTHVNMLSGALQDHYVREAEKVQLKKGFLSYLFFYNPELWKTPFATFIFRLQVVSGGIILIVIAYPIVFGTVTL